MNKLKLFFSQKENLILFCILTIAAGLRFYKFWLLDFTHDELSAIARLHFNSFGELIENGVKIDGHPAGTQVFMYFWCSIFGYGEFAVKLPFLIAGMASVYLVYLIGKRWFGLASAQLATAAYAVMQFNIYHQQIARPYCLGMFFILLAVWAWTNFLFPKDSEKNGKFIGLYLIGIVGAAYQHHFSAFAALLIGFSGLFLIPLKSLPKYIGINLLAVLAYLPHLPITLAQMKLGGIGGPDGWLDKPEPDFLINFLYYTFHFSWPFLILTTIALVLGIYFKKTENGVWTYRILGISWLLITFLAAYIYSLTVNPLLQFSTMTFVLPFFLLALFSFPIEKQVFRIPLVFLILLCGSYSLAKERRHYELMFNQPFDFFATESISILKEHPGKKYLAITSFGEYLMKTINDKHPGLVFLDREDELSFEHISAVIEAEKPEILFLQNIEPSWVEVLKYKYPNCIRRYFGFGFEFYALSNFKPVNPVKNEPYFYSGSKLTGNEKSFNYSIENIRTDSTGSFIEFNSDREFGYAFSSTIGEILSNQNAILSAEISFKADSGFKNAMLVASIDMPDSSLFWTGSDLQNFNNKPGSWNKAAVAASILENKNFPKDAKISFYIWNKDKQNFQVKDLEIKIYPGNDRVFGLIQKF